MRSLPSERTQSFPMPPMPWDEARLKPQITEDSTSQPGEHQADVIRSAMRTDGQHRQRLQPVRFEYIQVVRATEDPQNVEVTQRDNNQDRGLYQPPSRGQQSEASIDRHEDHVKSNDQGDIDREDGEITGGTESEEPFVRHDVPRRLRGIAEGYELTAYIELREDRRRQRKQIRESHHCRCFAL